jgi:hypothetical protein
LKKNFEKDRLTMLARQYPEIVKTSRKVIFCGEEDCCLSITRWKTEDETFEQAKESGFKIHLIELIGNFIEYRKQCNEHPNNEGEVCFGDDIITIEWMPNGSTELSGNFF